MIGLQEDPLTRATALSDTWRSTVLSGQVDTQAQDFTQPVTIIGADGDPYLARHTKYEVLGVRRENQLASSAISRSLMSHEFGLLSTKPVSTSGSLNRPATIQYATQYTATDEGSVLKLISSWQNPLNTLSLSSNRIAPITLCSPTSTCLGNDSTIDYTINQTINPSIVPQPGEGFQSNVISGQTEQMSLLVNPFEILGTVIVIVEGRPEKKRNKYSELLAKNLDHNGRPSIHPTATYNSGSSTSSNVALVHTAAKCLKC